MTIPEPLRVLSTIRDFIRWGSSEFTRAGLSYGHGFVNAFDETRYLVLHSLALPPDWPDAYLDAVLTEAERERVVETLQLRISSRQPVAYITRESWFCGLPFYVDERVLIPRSPIGELVGNYFEPWVDSNRVRRVLDLCTGSGCIAIAIQYAFPEAEVWASDISRDALEVAAINLERHDLTNRLRLVESDLFDALPGERFDVITCNPPYVDAEDMKARSEEFRYEPELGLAAGEDGLEVVDRILATAGDHLADDGVIFLEVGNSQVAMTEKYTALPMTWIEFEHGGDGVCCIRAEALQRGAEPRVEHA